MTKHGNRKGEPSSDQGYFGVRLNRQRCQPKLDRLSQKLRRSRAQIVEILLERATEADLMMVTPLSEQEEQQSTQEPAHVNA